jgi:hypothetical protein
MLPLPPGTAGTSGTNFSFAINPVPPVPPVPLSLEEDKDNYGGSSKPAGTGGSGGTALKTLMNFRFSCSTPRNSVDNTQDFPKQGRRRPEQHREYHGL